MRSISLLAGAFVMMLTLPALAQNQDSTPTNVRGKVQKLEGQTLTVKAREGKIVRVALAKDFGVLAVTRAKLADIKKGDFVGAAATKGKDGKLHAQEVLIFPEAARGTGEGHYPWDLTRDSTMTNATVAEVTGKSARTLKLQYKGGENEIVVPPGAPIVTFTPGTPELLKPGAAVFIRAAKASDGTISAKNVLVGKDGVKPPM